MALKVETLKREFVFKKDKKDIVLPDVNPNFTADQIRKHYCGVHPELLNAISKHPKFVDNNKKVVIEFVPSLAELG